MIETASLLGLEVKEKYYKMNGNLFVVLLLLGISTVVGEIWCCSSKRKFGTYDVCSYNCEILTGERCSPGLSTAMKDISDPNCE